MGLLDDAIRDHLELKRRHGASDEEIQQQENEALGPARREFAGAEPMAPLPPADVAAEEELAYEDDDELAYHDAAVEPEAPMEPVDPVPYAEEETAIYEPPTAEDIEAGEPAPHELADTEPAPATEADIAAPEEPPPPPPPREPSSSLPPMPEFPPAEPEEHPLKDQGDKLEELLPHDHPEEELDEESEEQDEDSEDVLEETPEFLQDAPEHDRLWFEQKPPRDFDFD
jgi:hypothetical protein